MSLKQATQITLSEKEEKILIQLKVGTHSAMHLKKRAEIILLANNGETNNSIERKLCIDADTITQRRNRYAKAHTEIARIEKESPLKLRSAVKDALSDMPRSGAPAKFTDEQAACITALSCEQPQNLGLPFSRWTHSLLKEEVIKRGIVDSISAMQIGRFLKRKRFKTS
jgi:hypothetical protein